ncbi:hypothetical protein AVEN_44452-1, partial [Araneus ventricosus]
YCRFIPRKICPDLRPLPRIWAACPRDLADNFEKTNNGSARSDNSGPEQFVSESKDYVPAEELISQQV